MSEHDLTLLRDPAVPPAALALIDRLSAELGARYGDDGGARSFRPEDVEAPGATFVTAWLGGRVVGCGALRPFGPITQGVAEVKRMYVEPDVRGRGIAGRVLAELEEAAREMGYRAIRLETGILQPEALRLYERAGYARIPCWRQYADDPHSRCFEKSVGSVTNG